MDFYNHVATFNNHAKTFIRKVQEEVETRDLAQSAVTGSLVGLACSTFFVGVVLFKGMLELSDRALGSPPSMAMFSEDCENPKFKNLSECEFSPPLESLSTFALFVIKSALICCATGATIGLGARAFIEYKPMVLAKIKDSSIFKRISPSVQE